MMEKIFRYSPARRLEATLFNIPIILLLFIIYIFFPKTSFPDALSTWIIYAMGAFYILPTIWFYIVFLRYKLEVSHDKFIVHTLFKKKELAFSEVKGYKIKADITLVHQNEEKKSLEIDEDIASQEGLEEWIIQQFDFIKGDEKANQQLTDILENSDFGETPRERRRNFKTTSRLARRFSGLSLLLFIYGMFVLWHNITAISLCAIYFVGLLLVFRKKGLATIAFPDESNIYPSYISFLFIPVSLFALRAIFKYDLLDYRIVWLYASPMILLFGISSYLALKKHLNLVSSSIRNQQWFMILVSSLVMGYYSTVTINCELSEAYPIEQQALVLSKQENDSSYSTMVRLTNNRELRLIIGEELFKSINKGDSLKVYIQQGLFWIPWVKYVEKVNPKNPNQINRPGFQP